MHLTAIGGFLVGVGAVLGLLPRVLVPARPELGIPFETMATRADRLRFAVETTGLASAAIGSIVLAVAELAQWWLELLVAALALLAVWGLAAHKLRQLWRMRGREAEDYPGADPPLASAHEQRELARANARPVRCLRRALSPTGAWPPPAKEVPGVMRAARQLAPRASARGFDGARLVPRNISDLHARDAQLVDLATPVYIRADLDAIRGQGYAVELVGDAVVVTGGGGTAQVSRSALDQPHALLARHRWLMDCEAIGVHVRPGPKGQPHVVGAAEWRQSSPAIREEPPDGTGLVSLPSPTGAAVGAGGWRGEGTGTTVAGAAADATAAADAGS